MSRWFGTLTPRKTLPSSDSASNITPSGKALTAGTTSTTTPFVAFEAVHAHLPAIAQSSSTAEGGESSKRAEREVVVEHWHFRPNVVGTPDDEEDEQVEGDAVDHDEADEHRSDEATDQHDREHATSASVDSTNNLLLRLVNRSSTLEIRPLSTYTTTPILRLSFPSRLIDLPPCTTYTHPVTGRMTVILVSATNRIHRLEIPPGGQYDEVEMYTNEIRRDVLVGTVVGWEVVSDVDLVVACGETLIRCSWDEDASEWSYQSLKPFSYLPSLSLSRFNPFSPSSHPSHASTTHSPHVVGVSTHVTPSSAFTYALGGDGRLRCWNLVMGELMGVVEVGAADGGLGKSGFELVRTIAVDQDDAADEDEERHFVVVFVPERPRPAFGGQGSTATRTDGNSRGAGTFKVYSVRSNGSQLGQMRLVSTVHASGETAGGQLRGFVVERVGSSDGVADGDVEMEVDAKPGGKTVGWRLWSLWDVDGGSALIQWTDVGAVFGAPAAAAAANGSYEAADESRQMVHIGSSSSNASRPLPSSMFTRWNTVTSPLAAATPTFDSTYFDALLPTSLGNAAGQEDDDYSDIPDTFLEHLFYPGRFSTNTLQACLEDYVESLRAAEDEENDELTRVIEASYPTLLEQTRAIVGCTVTPRYDDRTGHELVDELRKDLKNEWLGFWAQVQASDKQARWPVCMASAGEGREPVIVVSKEGLVVPAVVDQIGLVARGAGGGGAASEDEEVGSFVDVRSAAATLEADGLLDIPAGDLLPHYPAIASPSTRPHLFSLVKLARSLASRLSADDLEYLESDLFESLTAPLQQAPEEFGQSIYESRIHHGLDVEDIKEDLIAQLRACSPIHKFLNTLLDLLIDDAAVHTPPTDLPPSYLALALAIAGLSQQVHVRYAIIRDLLVLILYVHAHVDVLERGVDGEIYADLIARSLSVYHKYAVLRWLVERNGLEAHTAPSPNEEGTGNDGLPFNFEKLRMSGGRKSVGLPAGKSTTSYSLLHSALASQPALLPELSAERFSPAYSALLHAIGSAPQEREVIAMASDVAFGHRLVEHAHPLHALEFVSRYPPQVGFVYVRAEAEVALGRQREAVRSFEQVATGIDSPSWRNDSRSGLPEILPSSMQSDLSSYYRHIVDIYETAGHVPSVIHFAKLAIGAASSEDPSVEVLWTKVFRAYLALKRYEEAYVSMITNPFADLSCDVSGKDRPLGNLINAMCHDNEVQRLLRLSFIGFEDVIENELVFKARNSDPLAFPNYHQVLYAYYMQRKNYKDAGITMYQQGRRLGEHLHLGSDDFFAVAAFQAQCYLAAISAFSEVRPEHAWATLPVTNQSMLTTQTRKRRKLASYVPSKEFSEFNRDVEIVTLADIKKDYALILATLKVAPRFDMRVLDSPMPTARDVVSIHYEAGAYDDAFAAASGLEEDMTPIFQHLTERCLDLAAYSGTGDDSNLGIWLSTSPLSCSWAGTTADKAWRYLQIQLNRYDNAKVSRSYAEAVTDKIMARRLPLPSWLVRTELERFPEDLIRKALHHGLVEAAVEWSSEHLRKQPPRPSRLGEGGSRPAYTPYSLLDQVVAAASDPTYNSVTAVKASKILRSEMEKAVASAKAVKV